MKFNVLEKQYYIGRILYVLEYNNKILLVYKSSGLSGTNQENKFLPFGFLNERFSIREEVGYIFKEMYYNKKFIFHNKLRYQYNGFDIEKPLKIMHLIEQELPETYPLTAQEVQEEYYMLVELNEFENYVKIVNERLHEACKGKEFFDYYLDEIS